MPCSLRQFSDFTVKNRQDFPGSKCIEVQGKAGKGASVLMLGKTLNLDHIAGV
ncbi:MAG: hypothetical protein LBN39_06590 [Planctomycetaceae bacterium]|jgi:hypothetical protein|nr:hypothetical protein [Planctomycetaceae bacterium]